MTEPGPREPDYPSGPQEGAPERRAPQPPPSVHRAAATGGIGRADDQTATPPHGDEARGAAYDLGGDLGGDPGEGREEPRSPSGT